MGIDWSKIKECNQDYARNKAKYIKQGLEFEILAIEYLQDNFAEKWKYTSITRDGNKDAVSSVICGQKESWAEAKYTKDPRLPRYRLDATIVSALIHDKKIVKIIFITNSNIDNKIQTDIERALKNALGVSTEILFKTQYDIEFWLSNNKQYYTKHFNDDTSNLQSLQFNHVIADKISFYKAVRQSFCFREPLNELYVGNKYELIFSIFSPNDINDCEIELATKLISVSPSHINIKQGSNRICLKCNALSPGRLPSHLMTISNNKIILSKSISVKKEDIRIKIKSQTSIKNNLLKSFEEFKKGQRTSIYVINGRGGIGKTTMLENLIQNDSFKNIDIIYQSMSRDKLDSNIMIIDIILSILFYHADPTTIDKPYLERIKHQYISRLLKCLVDAKVKVKKKSIDNIEYFNTIISEYNESKAIFSNNIELNKKVIILDDLHKLDESSCAFLFNFLEDLCSSKIPCFIILCARDMFWKNQQYSTFKQKYPVTCYNYVFNYEDLYENLKSYKYNVSKAALSLLTNRMEISIFSTKSLLNFLQRHESKFDKSHPDSCHALINHFISENKYPTSIIELFNNLTTEEKDVVNLVYYSDSGVEKTSVRANKFHFFETLEEKALFRVETGKYYPYHDVYQDIFKYLYEPLAITMISTYLKTPVSNSEILRDKLLHHNSITAECKENILDNIIELTKQHKFYAISYILEPIFSRNIKEETKIIENRKANLGIVLYYNLKFYYAYAVTNCSKSINGDKEFECLEKEIKDILDPDIQCILLKVLAELVNSRHEHLLFTASHKYSSRLKKTLCKLEKEGYIEEGKGKYHSSFILSKEVALLSQTMLDQYDKAYRQKRNLEKLCKEKKDFNKIAMIAIRYNRLMLHHDIDLAYNNIEGAVAYLTRRQSTEGKWVLIGNFELCFINIVRGKINNIKELKDSHNKLEKDFNNDYYRGCLIVAACYIYWRMPDEAYQYLYKDYFKKRKINPRCEAIRLGLLALYTYLFEHNKQNAIACLNKQKKIFEKLGPSYHRVIDNNILIISSQRWVDKVAFFINTDRNPLYRDCLYIDPRIW